MTIDKKRKILRVKKGEYILAIHADRIETTKDMKLALDFTGIKFDLLTKVTTALYGAGYNDMKMMEVK